MFTGLIEAVGTVTAINRQRGTVTIKCGITDGIEIGDSMAVNGACLTAVEVGNDIFTADVMNETFSRTALGALSVGSRVNLERAMKADGRFGGHIVSGHIDGTGTVTNMRNDGNAVWVTVAAESEILRYIVEKGSIAIDGISLTVAYVDDKCFKVSIIPHTGGETTLLEKRVGDAVNLECDIIAKYVEKLMQPSENIQKSGITYEFLAENGF